MSDIPEEIPEVQNNNDDSPKSKLDFNNLCTLFKKYKTHILIVLIAILSYFVYKKKFSQVPESD
tara:strand:- start:1115 stop:1306 length:192 start_codon:yes stop_codon:yes gene_type:complete